VWEAVFDSAILRMAHESPRFGRVAAPARAVALGAASSAMSRARRDVGRGGASGATARRDRGYAGLAMRTLSYTVLFEPQPEGGYTVHVPALPGCVTEGETMEETRRMAEDAIRAYCESLVADGEPLPPDLSEPPRHERIRVELARG
jgi:predicted RNase H-like HicB family nuclease